MDRGRGHYTPSPHRGRGRGGWSRSSPSSGSSSDRPIQTHAGGDPYSPASISSGGAWSSSDGSGERSRHSYDRFRGGRQTRGQSQSASVWVPVRKDDSKASVGERCSPLSGGDKTDCKPVQKDASKPSLPELGGNYGSPHGNSSGSSGRQASRQWYKDWKQPQPVVPFISRDKTICQITVDTSAELNYGAEIAGCDLMQSDNSVLFSDCTKNGSADGTGLDPSLRENPGGLHAKASVSSKRSSHRKELLSGQRCTSQQLIKEWVVAKPVTYKCSKQSEGDLSSDCTVGKSESIVLEKGSSDNEHLDLNRSLVKNQDSHCENFCASTEYASSPEFSHGAETKGGYLMQSEKSDLSSDCTRKGSADLSPRENIGSLHTNSSVSDEKFSQRNGRPRGGMQTSRGRPQPNYSDRNNMEDLPTLGSLHAKYSALSERSPQGNQRRSSERNTSQQLDTGWVTVKPIYSAASSVHGCRPLGRKDLGVTSPEVNRVLEINGKDSSQSEDSDMSTDHNVVGKTNPGVLEKGFADGPLDLDRCSSETLRSPSDSAVGSESSKEGYFSLQAECSKPSDDRPFDICPPLKPGLNVVLKKNLHEINKEKRKDMNRIGEPKGIVLRTGMVHLKKFIPLSDQVKFVKECRELGIGPGGFYQPGYRDGAKLNLRMMCLGKNWDPHPSDGISHYGDMRHIDGAEPVKPPPIPKGFLERVQSYIQESHKVIAEEYGSTRSEKYIPWMSPDICLVNFYKTSGKLGLHQDHDESKESLRKGLPVVSISIGDSAEFLYGDEREVEKAEKVTLESGDVLIFGGESRLVFHGISSVMPNTAPTSLLVETGLCPGRLNLTFRQY